MNRREHTGTRLAKAQRYDCALLIKMLWMLCMCFCVHGMRMIYSVFCINYQDKFQEEEVLGAHGFTPHKNPQVTFM